MAGGFQRKSPEKLPTSAFRIRAWFRHVLSVYCQEMQVTTQPSTMADWVEFAGWLHEHVAWQKDPVDHTTVIGWFNGTHPPGAKANPVLADAFPREARVLNDKNDFRERLNILFGALDLCDASEYQKVISESLKSQSLDGDVDNLSLLLSGLAPISQSYVNAAILFLTKLQATVFSASLYPEPDEDFSNEKLALFLERWHGIHYLAPIRERMGGAVTADRCFVDLAEIGCNLVRKGEISNFLAYSFAAVCIALMLLRLHDKNVAPLGDGRTGSECLLDVAIACIFPMPSRGVVSLLDAYNRIARIGLSDVASRGLATFFMRVRSIMIASLPQHGSTLEQVIQMLWSSQWAVAQATEMVSVLKKNETFEDDDEVEDLKMMWPPVCD